MQGNCEDEKNGLGDDREGQSYDEGENVDGECDYESSKGGRKEHGGDDENGDQGNVNEVGNNAGDNNAHDGDGGYRGSNRGENVENGKFDGDKDDADGECDVDGIGRGVEDNYGAVSVELFEKNVSKKGCNVDNGGEEYEVGITNFER